MIESTVSSAGGVGSTPLLPSQSAASWPAIIAGAFAAAALTLVLLALGTGLGFASVSPWPRAGVSGMSLAVTAAIWLVLTQWLSAALGGYLAGRLRTRWVGTHTHEVFFRDTAHGFVTWAVASVVVAATLGTGVMSSLSAIGHAATDVAAQGAKGATTAATLDGNQSSLYGIDRLLRPSDPTSAAPAQGADPKPEVARIVANVVATNNIDDADRMYLAQVVVARTGVSQPEAQKRVDDLIASVLDTKAKALAAADTARKAAAQSSIYVALSMVIGAFIASVAAALGGQLRDEHP
jgi:hypothetical protein